MLKRITLAVAAAALFALAAFAQTPPSPPDPATMAQRHVNRLATLLNLTDAQKASAITIFTNALTANQSIQPNLRTNRESLQAAVKSNNASSIDSLTTTIGGLEGQIMANNSKAEAAFYAILTTDQKAKYDAMPHFGLGGPGGPGGPGRGMGMGRGMRQRPGQQ